MGDGDGGGRWGAGRLFSHMVRAAGVCLGCMGGGVCGGGRGGPAYCHLPTLTHARAPPLHVCDSGRPGHGGGARAVVRGWVRV